MTILKALKHKYCLILGNVTNMLCNLQTQLLKFIKRSKLTFLDTSVLNKINKNNVPVYGRV